MVDIWIDALLASFMNWNRKNEHEC